MEGSNDRFVEILGVVKDASTLVFMSCTEMGSDLVLSFLDSSLPFLLNVCNLFFRFEPGLVNSVIELTARLIPSTD